MLRHAIATLTLLALAACAGGGGSAPQAPVLAATATPGAAARQLVSTSFAVALAANGTASGERAPRFIGAGGKSVTITLTAISGQSIPVGLTTSVTSTIALPCPCTVSGPNVPAGIDSFTFTVYDGAGGTGNAIASTQATFTVALGVANSFSTVLNGIPASVSITNVPTLTAGTSSSTILSLLVKDADANAIVGTFATPLSITTNSPGGALGQQLTAVPAVLPPNFVAPQPGSGVTVVSSSIVVTLSYGGLATGPTSLLIYGGASLTNATIPITPVASPIVYSGPMNGTTPEVDLYATTGAGSSGTFTLGEVGYSNAPYSQAFSLTTSPTCASFATVTLTAPATYTVAVNAAPVAGTCQIYVSDIVSGTPQQLTITATYTGNSVGVQSRRSRTPR